MRNRLFFALDGSLLVVAIFAAYLIRFDGWSFWSAERSDVLLFVAAAVPLKLLVLWALGLYRRLWRYASIADVELLLSAAMASAGATFLLGAGILPVLQVVGQRVPIGVLIIDSLLTALVISMPRLLLRIVARSDRRWRNREGRRALIVGAGAAGGLIVKELLDNAQIGLVPVAFVDDDRRKHGQELHGVPVLGPVAHLPVVVKEHGIEEVITAMPSAPGRVVRDVVQRSIEAGIKPRTVPGLYEIISGARAVSALRQVEIQDVLRREPIQTDLKRVGELVSERTVLITGAGGSIGSELCRQLARLGPSRLVLLGRGENSIFELMQELRETFPSVQLQPAVIDIRDKVRLRGVYRQFQPYTVFHAAAHKHVPLMEANPDEAVLNNVLGTMNVAELAAAAAIEHLILISTDKAVRPTSIMGATKRIAEAIVHDVAQREGRQYASVRFGNVLGSRGSVVPTFLRQIAAGGPLTITHPEMRRYFMTIPEAVQLVLQAAAMAQGGDVFVLDMGEPVRILDLAHDLIRLSGLQVGTDIEIRVTGMRPGEKLYEELFFGEDVATPTAHPKILRARENDLNGGLRDQLGALIAAASNGAPAPELRGLISAIVPEYTGSDLPQVRPRRSAPRAASRPSAQTQAIAE